MSLWHRKEKTAKHEEKHKKQKYECEHRTISSGRAVHAVQSSSWPPPCCGPHVLLHITMSILSCDAVWTECHHTLHCVCGWRSYTFHPRAENNSSVWLKNGEQGERNSISILLWITSLADDVGAMETDIVPKISCTVESHLQSDPSNVQGWDPCRECVQRWQDSLYRPAQWWDSAAPGSCSRPAGPAHQLQLCGRGSRPWRRSCAVGHLPPVPLYIISRRQRMSFMNYMHFHFGQDTVTWNVYSTQCIFFSTATVQTASSCPGVKAPLFSSGTFTCPRPVLPPPPHSSLLFLFFLSLAVDPSTSLTFHCQTL